LAAGDRFVVVTDGMLERAAASVDLQTHIQATRALHPREATRALADLVLEACGGTLADDAALLVLDWHGDHDAPRRTVAGADRPRQHG
jgi:serine phosphatase RsbU (regulator of sigma subunit)